jgi:hypothetical protein
VCVYICIYTYIIGYIYYIYILYIQVYIHPLPALHTIKIVCVQTCFCAHVYIQVCMAEYAFWYIRTHGQSAQGSDARAQARKACLSVSARFRISSRFPLKQMVKHACSHASSAQQSSASSVCAPCQLCMNGNRRVSGHKPQARTMHTKILRFTSRGHTSAVHASPRPSSRVHSSAVRRMSHVIGGSPHLHMLCVCVCVCLYVCSFQISVWACMCVNM